MAEGRIALSGIVPFSGRISPLVAACFVVAASACFTPVQTFAAVKRHPAAHGHVGMASTKTPHKPLDITFPAQLAPAPGVIGSLVLPKIDVDSLIRKYAAQYAMPEHLLRRVVARESGFDPGQRHGPYWGLMQIRPDTARGVGYRGAPAGLLDPNVNLTYGGAYLANAWRISGGSEDMAVRLYSGGYYYEAKRKGMLGQLIVIPPPR